MRSESVAASPLKPIQNRAYSIWHALVTPVGKQLDADQQRRARMLGSVVLIGIPLILIVAMFGWLNPNVRPTLVSSAVILFGLLLLNRAGHFVMAAVTFVVLLSGITYAGLIANFVLDPFTAQANLVWLTTVMIAAYLFFSLPGLLLTIVANLFLPLLIPLFLPELRNGDYIFVVFFIAVVSVLITVAGLIRRYDQRGLALQEQRLAEEQGRYRDLFSAGFETLIIHRNGLILDVNPAAEEMFGVPCDTMLGRYLADLFAPESRDVVRSHSSASTVEMYEARGQRKDGGLLWVEVRGKEHQYRGQLVQVAAVRDVTQRRQAEAQQLELTIEREKVQVLQRFIGDMSHDLRTPLSVMKTSIYLINRLSGQPDKMMQHVTPLQKQIDLLQGMFDDLLSMSRLDRADTSEYQFRWVQPDMLVSDLVEEQRTLALRKNIQLSFQAETPPPTILLDQDEFRRMLKHLIMNALTYTPEGGKVEVCLYQREQWAFLEVNDNGPGIPSLDLPLIFERFYRGDKSRSKETGGTGIGLSIVKKIVEAHNGQIEAESILGQGTTFRVRLPARMPSPNAAAPEASA